MTVMANEGHKSRLWAGMTWFDRWSDRHPVLFFAAWVVLLAYANLPKRHFDNTFQFGLAMGIAVVLVSAVSGSAAAGCYLFVALAKKVAPERYETLGTTQKWYVRLLFGVGVLASFMIGPALLTRGLQMLGGTP